MQGTSKYIGNVGFTYTRPAYNGYVAYFFGSETYRSEANLSSSLSVYGIQQGYNLVNAGAGVRPENKSWEAELWGKNLLDTHYLTTITQASATAAVTGAPGDPITFGVTYRQKF